MTDLVGTCPKHRWDDWVQEGDPAGTPWSGIEWGWFTRHPLARDGQPGDRFYVVAHGKLRGWAPIVRVARADSGEWVICRHGDAVACTVPRPIPGFQGLQHRWWNRAEEVPFPDWRVP
jgi:hypothetical protein